MVFVSSRILHALANLISTSFLRFLIRAVPHYVYLSPKPVLPPPLPPSPPSPPPSLALILLSNLPPLLLHIFTRPPSGSEAARGYLHGGILIDFVGQEAPASKLKLVALDLLVLGLQVAMMALVLERRGLEPPTRPADGSSSAATQDHDAEERGVLLLSSSATETREPPPPPSSAARLSIDRDRNADVREDAGSSSEQHPLDAFRSGQYVVANLRFTNIARDEWLRYKEHVGRSSALESDVRGRSAERRARRNADRGRELEARLRFVAGWR